MSKKCKYKERGKRSKTPLSGLCSDKLTATVITCTEPAQTDYQKSLLNGGGIHGALPLLHVEFVASDRFGKMRVNVFICMLTGKPLGSNRHFLNIWSDRRLQLNKVCHKTKLKT